ncbi:MAG: HMA2 domain-containing protein [Methylobacter sp.]
MNKASSPSAYIKHHLPGRVRLKIPQKKGDAGYFDRIAELFADFPGITQLQLNPTAASVLICHDGTEAQFGNISEFAQRNGLFSITERLEETFSSPPLPIAVLTATGLNRFDESLMDLSQGRIDSRSLFMLTLTGLAIHQITRGNIMAPASSLLWYAIELLREENITPPINNQ